MSVDRTVEIAPTWHLFHRVDPSLNLEELRTAEVEMIRCLEDAVQNILQGRLALLNAGCRDAHPLCIAVDNLTHPVAAMAEAQRRGWLRSIEGTP